MSLAKAFVTGVVTKAPEKRFTQNDMAVTGFTVNIDSNNEILLRVIAFGQLAENVASTVAVGDNVAIEGRLQINSFKTPDGKDKRVYEISANAVERLSSMPSGASANIAQNSENIVSINQDEIAQDLIDEDEIPF